MATERFITSKEFSNRVKTRFKRGNEVEQQRTGTGSTVSSLSSWIIPQKYLSEKKTKLTFYVSSVLTNI
jgi:hypothetical protein